MSDRAREQQRNRRFPALAHRNYRLFWLGGVLTNNGRWTQYVATYYVVYRLTESAAWVGAAAFSTFIPMLLTNPVAGHVSDRFDRRLVLLCTNTACSLLAAAMAVCWAAGLRSPWAWMALLLVGGFVYGIQLPTWQSFVAECVPREHLRNAITLNSTQFNAARTVGPALGGFVIGTFGPGWALAVAAMAYGPILTTLSMIRTAELFRPDPGSGSASIEGSVWGQYRESIRYVLDSPGIRTAILTTALVSTMGQPVVQQIVVFAEEVFEVSPFWFGMLGSAQGIGALLAAPVVAGELSHLRRSRIQFFATCGYGMALALFALAPTLWMGFVGLGLIGAMHLASASNLNSTVQLQVEDARRGRVMALYLMGVLGVSPFANLLMGGAIALFGPRPVVAVAGLVVLAGGLYLHGTGRFRLLDAG
ncbi:MAG: MFS transporter [Actinomycetota bacterium]|nr:MFS transporter [Actinomycetota bacterium]